VTLVFGICDGLQELAVAPRTADILGRTAPGALDEQRIGDARTHRRDGFQHHDAAPAVAVVVKILEGALAIDEECGQLDLALVIHLSILGRGHAIHDVSELEVVQVIIGPAHDDLNDVVQAFERHARRRLDPAPDRRIDIEQSDRDTDDLILHAATLMQSRFQFHGNNSSILLAG
jgi:hypothetical protein